MIFAKVVGFHEFSFVPRKLNKLSARRPLSDVP